MPESSVQNFLPYTDCNAPLGSTFHRLNIYKFTKIEK